MKILFFLILLINYAYCQEADEKLRELNIAHTLAEDRYVNLLRKKKEAIDDCHSFQEELNSYGGKDNSYFVGCRSDANRDYDKDIREALLEMRKAKREANEYAVVYRAKKQVEDAKKQVEEVKKQEEEEAPRKIVYNGSEADEVTEEIITSATNADCRILELELNNMKKEKPSKELETKYEQKRKTYLKNGCDLSD